MAYTETEQDVDQQEQETAPVKEALAAALLVIFARIEEEFRDLYVATGIVLDTVAFEASITEELRRGYIATNAIVGGKPTDFIVANQQDSLSLAVSRLADKTNITFAQQVQQILNATEDAVDSLYVSRLDFVVPKITLTTNQKLQLYIDDIVDVVDAGTPNALIAELASNRFRELAPWRSGFIASTEVDTIASGIQQMEMDTLEESLDEVEDVKPVFYKEWITRGDDLVRPAHRDADGQVRASGEPFEVGGEELRFPRDESLGATIGNTANCRCASVRVLDAEL